MEGLNLRLRLLELDNNATADFQRKKLSLEVAINKLQAEIKAFELVKLTAEKNLAEPERSDEEKKINAHLNSCLEFGLCAYWGETMSDWEKTLTEATIQNNFVFGKTMELYPDLCRRLLEFVLKTKITAIRYPEREKTIESRSDAKGIRLDVFVEEVNDKRWFDVEMQITDSANLAKRMRYYQGLIDIDKLKRGQHYSELSESYIIFICPFDHFKGGRHVYTFQERCAENPNLLLNDGATKIFLNTKGTCDDVTPELKAFLDYVDCGIVSGEFVKELDAAVKSIKTNEKVRHDFMTLQMALLEERMAGEERGRAQGITQGIEAVAIKMIRRGKTLDEVSEFTDVPIQRLRELARFKTDGDEIKSESQDGATLT